MDKNLFKLTPDWSIATWPPLNYFVRCMHGALNPFHVIQQGPSRFESLQGAPFPHKILLGLKMNNMKYFLPIICENNSKKLSLELFPLGCALVDKPRLCKA